jgi:hypothetical protein
LTQIPTAPAQIATDLSATQPVGEQHRLADVLWRLDPPAALEHPTTAPVEDRDPDRINGFF